MICYSAFLLGLPLFWFQIGALAIFGFTAIFYFLRKNNWFVVSCLASIIAALLLAWYYYAHSLCWVRVMKPTLLYGGPSMHYHQVGEFAKDTVCYISRYDDHWICLKDNQKQGWLLVS